MEHIDQSLRNVPFNKLTEKQITHKELNKQNRRSLSLQSFASAFPKKRIKDLKYRKTTKTLFSGNNHLNAKQIYFFLSYLPALMAYMKREKIIMKNLIKYTKAAQ